MTVRSGPAATGEELRGDAFRFAGAGIVNTAVTYLIYQALLFVMPPPIAYSVTWIVGIAIVAVFYPSRVFRGGDMSGRARLLVVLVYGAGYVLGLATVTLLSARFGIPRLAILVALLVTTLFNFFAMRFVTRRKLP